MMNLHEIEIISWLDMKGHWLRNWFDTHFKILPAEALEKLLVEEFDV